MNYKQKTVELNQAVDELKKAAYDLRETTEYGKAENYLNKIMENEAERFKLDFEYSMFFGGRRRGKVVILGAGGETDGNFRDMWNNPENYNIVDWNQETQWNEKYMTGFDPIWDAGRRVSKEEFITKYPLTPDEVFPKRTLKVCTVEEITENGWVIFNDTYFYTGKVIDREHDGESFYIIESKRVEDKLHARLSPTYNNTIWSIKVGDRFAGGIQLYEEKPKQHLFEMHGMRIKGLEVVKAVL